jgi:hypothetical protein
MRSSVKIIPRDELVDGVVKRVLKSQHVWLSSPAGYGKTTIIQEAVDELADRYDHAVIFCQESTQFKPLLLDIAEQLHSQGLLVWEQLGAAVNETSWAKVFAKLDRVSVVEVAPIVAQSLAGKNIILVLDHLEGVRASYLKHYARFFEVATVIAASDSFQNVSLKKLRPLAQIMEVPAFTPAQAEELSDFLFEHYGINASDEESFKRQVVRAANGAPAKLVQLYEDAATEGFIKMDYIRQLRSQAGREFTNVGWLLLLLLALPMVGRVVAVGSGDRDGFIAFGVLSAFAFVMRYLVYRGSRQP